MGPLEASVSPNVKGAALSSAPPHHAGPRWAPRSQGVGTRRSLRPSQALVAQAGDRTTRGPRLTANRRRRRVGRRNARRCGGASEMAREPTRGPGRSPRPRTTVPVRSPARLSSLQRLLVSPVHTTCSRISSDDGGGGGFLKAGSFFPSI